MWILLASLSVGLAADPPDDDTPAGQGTTQDPARPSSDDDELRKLLQEEADKDKQEPRKATDPITIASGNGGKNYMQIALDGLFAAGGSSASDVPALQLGSHDPSRRGFNLQNLELVFSGAVDPYFTAQANIVFVEAPDGETIVEAEELFAQTSSLPANLQVKAGHFYTELGRLNQQHPHTWDFVDQPLSSVRILGSDGLRSTGVRVSWLMPLPFYSELYVTVQNAFGETLTSFGSNPGETVFGRTLGERQVSGLEDLLYVPRYNASFDVTENQTLLVGASAAVGPNATGENGWTNIYGADVFWKWKSPRAQAGFPFVKVQAEKLWRRYRADDPLAATTFEDHGGYVQASWGFKRGWVVGARYDHVGGDDAGVVDDPFLERRSREAVNLTWYPTEFSKLRLQYNRDDRTAFDDANSVWMQYELVLGAHAAHKF